MLSGIVVPAVTPMTVTGDIDTSGISTLVDHLVDGGVDGIFIFGTCGEGPSLTREQRRQSADAFATATRGRVPLLAGIAGNSVAQCLESLRDVTDAGADAVVIMTPLFLSGMGEELVESHLRMLANKAEIPVVLYNIPQHTQNAITPPMLERLAQIPNVVAIKDSSASDDTFRGLLEAGRRAGIDVFQGAETMIASSLRAGASGAVPGVGNVIPEVVSALYSAARGGEWDEAERLQDVVDEACAIFGSAYWLLALKYAVSRVVGCGPTPARGLRAVTPEEAAAIDDVLVRVLPSASSVQDEEVAH